MTAYAIIKSLPIGTTRKWQDGNTYRKEGPGRWVPLATVKPQAKVAKKEDAPSEHGRRLEANKQEVDAKYAEMKNLRMDWGKAAKETKTNLDKLKGDLKNTTSQLAEQNKEMKRVQDAVGPTAGGKQIKKMEKLTMTANALEREIRDSDAFIKVAERKHKEQEKLKAKRKPRKLDDLLSGNW